jgi:hypothetical protein
VSPPAGKGKGEEVEPDQPIFRHFSRRGATIPVVPKVSQNRSRQFQDFLGAVFVILKLFNVIFV